MLLCDSIAGPKAGATGKGPMNSSARARLDPELDMRECPELRFAEIFRVIVVEPKTVSNNPRGELISLTSVVPLRPALPPCVVL